MPLMNGSQAPRAIPAECPGVCGSALSRFAHVEPAAHLQIVVADSGHGFAPDRLHAVGAHGLGLTSIRQRLEYLGGILDIASAPGQGSRFTLSIPLSPG